MELMEMTQEEAVVQVEEESSFTMAIMYAMFQIQLGKDAMWAPRTKWMQHKRLLTYIIVYTYALYKTPKGFHTK